MGETCPHGGDPIGTGEPQQITRTSSLTNPESHVPKSIRSLVHFAIKYGYTPKGGVPGALANGKEIIPGIGDVDGSLFVRVAGKIMETQGWIKSGAKEADWDRSALGWDGAWGKPKAEGRWGGGTND
jgi:hypothetical protein